MLIGDHILIQSKLNMRKITHIQLINSFLSFLRGCTLEQLPIIPQTDDIDDGVHVGGARKIQPCADVFPVVFLRGLLVLPVQVLVLLIFPEHQVHQYLL